MGKIIDIDRLERWWGRVKTALEGKYVQQVSGKGLSTEDYTTAEKEKLGALPTSSELTTTFAGKQDVISDLSTIRTQAGAAAPQSTTYTKAEVDAAIDADVLAEETRAKAAEQANADDIDAIETKIPTGASAQNKLATEAFVNSSVATATATYRGDYNLVTDLSLTTEATRAQIETALASAISTADNNDYCFVQIPTADATPTEVERIERYKYNGTAWGYEYTLNNSGYTAAQWAAINSYITSGLVTKLSDLPTSAELTTLLAGKVDKVSGKGLSTEDYTTAEKTKLGNLPSKPVSTEAEQGLTSTEQANARTNIGAVSANDNVASATKLKTSRKLWGNNFDGTASIPPNDYWRASMSNVGGIDMKGVLSGAYGNILGCSQLVTDNWTADNDHALVYEEDGWTVIEAVGSHPQAKVEIGNMQQGHNYCLVLTYKTVYSGSTTFILKVTTTEANILGSGDYLGEAVYERTAYLPFSKTNNIQGNPSYLTVYNNYSFDIGTKVYIKGVAIYDLTYMFGNIFSDITASGTMEKLKILLPATPLRLNGEKPLNQAIKFKDVIVDGENLLVGGCLHLFVEDGEVIVKNLITGNQMSLGDVLNLTINGSSAEVLTTGTAYKKAEVYTKTEADALLGGKQGTLTFDNVPTDNSTNPVKSGGVYTALGEKVDKVAGKQLSTEDYTTAEKTKLGALPTSSELNTALAGKQGTISDLATIRSQAAAAAPQSTTYTKMEVDAAIAAFITASVNNLTNYYLKSETYTKAEVAQLIAAVKQFRYEVAAELPTASAETVGIIYLIPSTNAQTQNVKDEYITISSINEQQETVYAWEQIGSTTVDLSGYYTSLQTDSAITTALNIALASYSTTTEMGTAISTALASYYTKTETDTLLAGKQGTINDLSTIRSGASAGATAYQKPLGGIPSTDMSSEVQTSLGKADTALQEHQSLSNYYTKPETDAEIAAGVLVEETRAKAAEKANADDIDAIEAKIPAQASSNNQLADKQFVNSSITTSTATYRGSYNLVSDLSLTTAATEQQIVAALVAVIQTADNNDYSFVQVPTADATPTEIARVDRYKYNGSAWVFEFSLNNSGFTAAQWAALNSGITSGLVAILEGLANVATSGDYRDLNHKPTIGNGTLSFQDGEGLPAGSFSANQTGNVTIWFRQGANILVEHYDDGNNFHEFIFKTTGLPTTSEVATAIATALASYYTSAQVDTLLTNKLANKADKSEMSVTAGTGSNADKTTIQLKSGTSATVLTAHQDISGKQNVIGDLQNIRSGAAAGATAYQKPITGIPDTDMTTDTYNLIYSLKNFWTQPTVEILTTFGDIPTGFNYIGYLDVSNNMSFTISSLSYDYSGQVKTLIVKNSGTTSIVVTLSSDFKSYDGNTIEIPTGGLCEISFLIVGYINSSLLILVSSRSLS